MYIYDEDDSKNLRTVTTGVFEHLLGSIERLMEIIGASKSKIDRVKDAMKSGIKSGVKEMGRIVLMELLLKVTGIR